MGRSKLEDHFRDRLQERELTPSPGAWEELEQRLDKEGASPRNRTVFWFALAASFVGVIFLLGALYFNSPTESQLVQEEVNTSVEKTIDPVQQISESEEPIEIAEDSGIQKLREDLKEEVNKPKPILSKEADVRKPKEDIALITTKEVENHIDEKESSIDRPFKEPNKEEAFIQGKVEEVVAEIQHQEDVTDDEVEALLAKAQRDIANYRILQSQSNKIDAAALLMDVEIELEQSFRDRVFQVLGEGFTKIRTAVAERNQ